MLTRVHLHAVTNLAESAQPSDINSAAGPIVRCTRRKLIEGTLISSLAFLAQIRPSKAANKKGGGSGDWTSPGLASKEDSSPGFVKSSEGVKIQELSQGQGRSAENGDRVELQYVLRRTNGYFIYSTVEGVSFQPKDIPTGPFEFRLGEAKVISGLQDAVRGMQPGGKRRVLVPPELGFVDESMQPQPPTFATKRQLLNHSREPLMFEILLLANRGK